MKIMKTSLILFMVFFATISAAQAYSQHFAADGTFTNVQGMFFTGHQAFLDRHEEIFKGMLRGTVLRQEVVSLKFVRPDTAVVETRAE